MEERTIVRYSSCFKRQVVDDLENGRFSSISQAESHYGIKGRATIKRWLKKYGRNHLCAKVVRVEKFEEEEQIKHLKKQLRRLREALGQTQAEKVVIEEYLKMACEEMGQDVEQFKKKADIELSGDAGRVLK